MPFARIRNVCPIAATAVLPGVCFALCAFHTAAQPAAFPMQGAVAVWHMNGLDDAAGANSALAPTGEIRLGVPLEGADREASLARGGDGVAAECTGGYLAAGQGADGELNLAGTAMTMCLRLKMDADVVDTPLFSKHGGAKALTCNLFRTDLGAGPAFGFELGTDAKEQPLRVSLPVALAGAGVWHDLMVRFTGPKLELFVDGVLADEEWPMGALRQGNREPFLIGAESYDGHVKTGFRGWIDHAALWNRALTDDEIAALSGGRELVAQRDRDIFGPPAASLQYWRPRGVNANVGDCMPFFHDGRFHLFYLFDRRHHGSKWGLGAHQWAHASTTDLVHWEQHPMALPITEQWEGSICTGSVFFHDGVYYAHYAVRMPDGKQHLAQATSTDGVHFEKSPHFPLASPQAGYDPMHYRDPLVFEDEKPGLFHMLVTARLTDGRDGCIAQLLSNDLRTWTLADPFLVPGRVTDCPDCFSWNGRHYLFAEFVYWTSENQLGPWNSPDPDKLDVMYVPKTAPFTGGRRLYVSWLPDGGWGGDTVFRELIQHDDGTLGTKFVPEMIPDRGAPVAWSLVAAGNNVSSDGDSVRIEAGPGLRTAMFSELPRDFRMTMRITPAPDAKHFGIAVRATEGYRQGCELRFEPHAKRVQFGNANDGALARDTLCAIENVEGLDRPFTLDLVAKGDILDACVDNRRTIIVRYNGDGVKVFTFVEKGGITIDGIEVSPMLN